MLVIEEYCRDTRIYFIHKYTNLYKVDQNNKRNLFYQLILLSLYISHKLHTMRKNLSI